MLTMTALLLSKIQQKAGIFSKINCNMK